MSTAAATHPQKSQGSTMTSAPKPASAAQPVGLQLPFHDIQEMIGNTPMLEFRRLDTGPCQLFGKMELANPGGSIKDRIGLSMISAAERDGTLKPGGTIVEATAGNTGLGLALVGLMRGYQVIVVVPDKMSQIKIDHLRAMGATVMLTRSDVAKGHPEYYQEVAERIAAQKGAFYANQFGNPNNFKAHYETTGPEIWEQMEGRIDAFVAGVGSGGTLTGTGRYLREKNPNIDIICGDPQGSIIADLANCGVMIEPGSWMVEGLGEDFVPPILDMKLISKAYTISDTESFHAARLLLQKEGVLAGSSTGVLLAAALRYCREQKRPRRVVTFVCDTGNKYLNKFFNDFWMVENGFLTRTEFGDLRDLISRRHSEHEDYTVSPEDSLANAFGRMKLFAISQVPVTENGSIVGIIDESDLLLAVRASPQAFKDPVRLHMATKLETLPPTARIDDLVPVFRAGKVALIKDDRNYYGLITQSDLLTYLRRRTV